MIRKIIKRLSTAARFLRCHLHNTANKTYYPQLKQKPWLSIAFENFIWMAKNIEINHFYYLYGFDVKEKKDQLKFLPLRHFRKLRDRANMKGQAGVKYICLLRDKFLFSTYLKSLGAPTPEIIALCDNKTITWMSNKKTEDIESLLQCKNLDAFIKGIAGQCANDVHMLQIKNNDMFLDGEKTTIDYLRSAIKDKSIIQQRVYQHEKLARLHPHSVNTIRLITIRGRDGDIKAYPAIIRMAVDGKFVDNSTVGGLVGSVNIETAKLGKYAFFRPGFGGKVTRHPNTSVVFEDFEIPYFADAVNWAKKLHPYFNTIHSIGWDIAITEDGPTFIEANDNWEIPTFQALNGGLKDWFLKTLP